MMMMNDPHLRVGTQHMKRKRKRNTTSSSPPSNKKQFRPRPLPPPRPTPNINIIHSIPSAPPPPLILPHPQSPLKILLKPLHTPDIDRIAQHLASSSSSSSPPTPTQQFLMQIIPPQQNRQQRKSQRTPRTRNFQTHLESFRIERFFFFI